MAWPRRQLIYRCAVASPAELRQAAVTELALSCAECGWSSPVSDLAWRCGRCHGILDLTGFTPAMPSAGQLAGRPQTLWRYRESLPVSEPAGLSMGEGMTPLLPVPGRPADQPGIFYASHVCNPVFLHGTKTYAFELWEQLGGRLPGTLVLPVGNGTLVLGCHLGARELLDQGLIDRLPAIVAVQADACAPLARAMSEGKTRPAEISTGADDRGRHRHRPAGPRRADPRSRRGDGRVHRDRDRPPGGGRPRRPGPVRALRRADLGRVLGRGPRRPRASRWRGG
jgi:Pyridoxal-phosphate dependent enzyme